MAVPAACRDVSGAEEQAAVRPRQRVELWDLGQAETVGVGGVDAADERVDEAFMNLVAETGPDELADRVGVE